MKRSLSIVLVIFSVLLAACGNSGIQDPLNYEIEDFTFTDQHGKDLGLNDLKGKVWIGDFVFTNCTTICSPMTYNMANLQKMVREEGIKDVEFVSFSVDPANDTPEVLKEYGERFEIEQSNFHFLTGYNQEFIEDFALDNFKTLVKKPENEDQVIHQSYFFLVNQEGVIMKYYPGAEGIPFDEIISDIKKLQ